MRMKPFDIIGNSIFTSVLRGNRFSYICDADHVVGVVLSTFQMICSAVSISHPSVAETTIPPFNRREKLHPYEK